MQIVCNVFSCVNAEGNAIVYSPVLAAQESAIIVSPKLDAQESGCERSQFEHPCNMSS